MKFFKAVLATAIIGVMFQKSALATTVTGTVTADNHYALLAGGTDGSNIQFSGRNEMGPAGNPGTFNWSLPETYNFNLGINQTIFMAAWSDNRFATNSNMLEPVSMLLIGLGGLTGQGLRRRREQRRAASC